MDEIDFYIKYVINPLIERQKIETNKKLLLKYDQKLRECNLKLEKMIAEKREFYKKIAKDIKL